MSEAAQAQIARWITAGHVFSASAALVQAQITSPLASIGTLACITSETPPATTADAELSCEFHATSGRDAKYRLLAISRG